MDWYSHLQVLHRATGNSRFEFSHDVEVYVFLQDGAWRVLLYVGDRYQHGVADHDGPALNRHLRRFADLELVSMAVGP